MWFNIKNQENIFQFAFLTRQIEEIGLKFEFAILTQKSKKLIWICDLSWKIKKIYLNLNFWQENSSKLIWICNLDSKIKDFNLNLWFDMKNQENIFEFSIQICVFDKKNPLNWFEFAILTGEIKKN